MGCWASIPVAPAPSPELATSDGVDSREHCPVVLAPSSAPPPADDVEYGKLCAAACDAFFSESENFTTWEALGGDVLEPPIVSGAIALIDAQFIVDLHQQGGRIVRRQDLPPEAFIDLSLLKKSELNRKNIGLRIICVSYPWLQPDNPDPHSAHLATVARMCKAYIAGGLCPKKLQDGGAWAVMWDYMSLHQRPSDGGDRTATEAELFGQGLGSLAAFYAHPYTTVFKLTVPPCDWPHAYSLPDDANIAEYGDRGWCFTEQSWASMVKPGFFCLDVGNLERLAKRRIIVTVKGVQKEVLVSEATDKVTLLSVCVKNIKSRLDGRKPAVCPQEFAAALESRRFTNGKEDKPLVRRLYEDSFTAEMGKPEMLDFNGLGWDDGEARGLAQVLSTGACINTQHIDMRGNCFSYEGARAIADVLADRTFLPKLKAVDFRNAPNLQPSELEELQRTLRRYGVMLATGKR